MFLQKKDAWLRREGTAKPLSKPQLCLTVALATALFLPTSTLPAALLLTASLPLTPLPSALAALLVLVLIVWHCSPPDSFGCRLNGHLALMLQLFRQDSHSSSSLFITAFLTLSGQARLELQERVERLATERPPVPQRV